MKLYTLEAEQRLPLPLGEAWDFFSDPRNLAKITPPSLAFVVTSPLPPRMYPGMIVTYTVRPLLGVKVGWVTEITHVREPWLFVDEQRFGPYRFWHHQHHFREVPGGTEARDLVHYSLPRGARAGNLLVARQLREIFAFRRAALEKMFGTLKDA